MRREAAILDDIVRSADAIIEICSGLQLAALIAYEVAQAAILHHFTVIGEAANRVPDELRVCHPEGPWSRIVSQRNRVVHDYFGLDWTLLWKTITEDLPRLRNQVFQILAVEFPEE